MADLHVAGLIGSLRADSYNLWLMEAAREILANDALLDIVPIGTLPFYNQDVDQRGAPEVVAEFRERIRRADGLVIATPEYNYSMPGVLKNAIEWASRPMSDPALRGKPIALMGATPGLFGTVRAQLALRQVFSATNNPVVNRPEVLVAQAAQKFDAEGRLVDRDTSTFLRQSLESFVRAVRDVRPLATARI